MITLNPVVCKAYTDAHPAAKPYINKPIDNYEGLRVICGDDQATGSYATSVFSDFGNVAGNDDMTPETVVENAVDQTDEEGDADITPPVATSPAVSSSVNKVRRSTKRAKAQEDAEMADLIRAVCVMVDAIKNPSHWTELLYAKVMEVEGFSDEDKETMFDYLEENEHAARRFIAKRADMRYVWMKKYLSPTE